MHCTCSVDCHSTHTARSEISMPVWADLLVCNDTCVQVALPSTLLGVTHDNPKIRALHEKLADITRRIASNDLQIPPEGQRSPSPGPIYDRNGQRLNTREVLPDPA